MLYLYTGMWEIKRYTNYTKTLIGLAIIVSFSFLALFGLSLSMTTDEHGMMSNCPFMSQTEVICPMQVGEHIAKWQQAVTGIPQKFMSLAFVALLTLVSWYFLSRFMSQGSTVIASVLRRLKRERGLPALFNIFHRLFSQGILHPKIYEATIV